MNNLIKFDPLMVLACLEIVKQYCDQNNGCTGCLFYNKDHGCGFTPNYNIILPYEWDIERFHKNLMWEARKKFEGEDE